MSRFPVYLFAFHNEVRLGTYDRGGGLVRVIEINVPFFGAFLFFQNFVAFILASVKHSDFQK